MAIDKRPQTIRAARDKERPYFSLSRAVAQNRELSWEARGVMSYLLSKPDDWQIQVSDLRQKNCGRDKVYRILDELMAAGYLHRHQEQDKKGKFLGYSYVLYEEPFTENQETDKDTTPFPEKPYTDLPFTENQEHTYKREEQKKESNTFGASAPDGSNFPKTAEPETTLLKESAKAESLTTASTLPDPEVKVQVTPPPVAALKPSGDTPRAQPVKE